MSEVYFRRWEVTHRRGRTQSSCRVYTLKSSLWDAPLSAFDCAIFVKKENKKLVRIERSASVRRNGWLKRNVKVEILNSQGYVDRRWSFHVILRAASKQWTKRRATEITKWLGQDNKWSQRRVDSEDSHVGCSVEVQWLQGTSDDLQKGKRTLFGAQTTHRIF